MTCSRLAFPSAVVATVPRLLRRKMKSQDHVKTNNRLVQINQLINLLNLFPDIDFISLIFCFLKHVCFSLEISHQ